jgi:hypothetical protein
MVAPDDGVDDVARDVAQGVDIRRPSASQQFDHFEPIKRVFRPRLNGGIQVEGVKAVAPLVIGHLGVNVPIPIFCDFHKFRAKNRRFY